MGKRAENFANFFLWYRYISQYVHTSMSGNQKHDLTVALQGQPSNELSNIYCKTYTS